MLIVNVLFKIKVGLLGVFQFQQSPSGQSGFVSAPGLANGSALADEKVRAALRLKLLSGKTSFA